MQGTMQAFNVVRGFGFIVVDFRTRFFMHVSNYKSDVVPTEGLVVTFDIAPPYKPGGLDQAVNVTPITAQTSVATPVSAETSTGGVL
jgi:cold shock CspA family protein